MADEFTPAPFLLPLSHAQVQQMVQAVADVPTGTGLLRVLLALTGQGGERLMLTDLASDELYDPKEISRSVVSSLIVLAAFSQGEEHAVTELALEIGMTTSTTLRYIRTWVALGVLERVSKPRARYRLVSVWAQNQV